MTNQATAETTAGNSGILSQDTNPLTSTSQTNGRDPATPGNTQTETRLDKPLTYDQKVEIIRAAIEAENGARIKQWGLFDLSRLINHYEKEGVSPNQWITFFTDLLFFIAKPEISPAFHKALPNGLDRIGKLMEFFNELDVDFDEYAAWCDHRFVEYEETISEFDFKNIAQAWLKGADLKAVIGDDEGPGEFRTMKDAMKHPPLKEAKEVYQTTIQQNAQHAHEAKEEPAKTIIDAKNFIIRFDLNKVKLQPLMIEPEEKSPPKKVFTIPRSSLPLSFAPLKLSGKNKPAPKKAARATSKKPSTSKPSTKKKA